MANSVTIAAAPARDARVELLAHGGLAIATLGWAAGFVAGKLVVAEMTPLPAAAWRYALASLLLLPFAFRQRAATDRRLALTPLLIMTVCGGILYPWTFLSALSRTSATNTSLLIALNPVFTILLAPLVGEHWDRRRFGAVVLALLGAATVITKGDLRHIAGLTFNAGDLLAVAAAVMWAAFNLASRRVVQRLAPALTNCVIYGIGAVALGALGWSEHPWTQLTAASPTALTGLVIMATLSSVIAGQLFLIGMRALGVSRTVVYIYVVPVLTAAASVALLGEQFYLAQAVGGAAVLAGVYWSGRPRGG